MNKSLKYKIGSVLENSKKPLHIKDISDFFPGIPESTVRGRLNENVGSLFERLGDGFYVLKGEKGSVGLLEGDARNLQGVVADSSVDMLIADHPWDDEKSHKGGSRQFADDYGCFRYDVVKNENGEIIGSSDFKEKARILKDGGFLIEILPEKNANNRKYLREIEDAAEAEGLEYFAEVPMTGGNSNIGRKEKNISVVWFFTKGKARKLKIWSEELSRKSKEGELKYFDYKKHATDFFKMYYETLSVGKLDETFEAHSSKKELAVFKRAKTSEDIELLKLAFDEFKNFLSSPNSFKSGTKKILPEFLKGENVSDIRYQSQKPLNTLEDLILLTTNEGEFVVERFARSFVCGEAVISLGNEGYGWRNYLGVELDGRIVKEAKEYLSQKYCGVQLLTREDFINESGIDETASETSPDGLLGIMNKLNTDLSGIVKARFVGNFCGGDQYIPEAYSEGKVLSCSVNTNKSYELEIYSDPTNSTFELWKDGTKFKTSKPGARLDDLLIGIYNTFR